MFYYSRKFFKIPLSTFEFNCGKEEEYDEDDCVANEDTIKCLSSGKCISR